MEKLSRKNIMYFFKWKKLPKSTHTHTHKNNKMGSDVNAIKNFKAFQLLGKQTPPPLPLPPHMLYKMSKNVIKKNLSKQHLIHNLAAHNWL